MNAFGVQPEFALQTLAAPQLRLWGLFVAVGEGRQLVCGGSGPVNLDSSVVAVAGDDLG